MRAHRVRRHVSHRQNDINAAARDEVDEEPRKPDSIAVRRRVGDVPRAVPGRRREADVLTLADHDGHAPPAQSAHDGERRSLISVGDKDRG